MGRQIRGRSLPWHGRGLGFNSRPVHLKTFNVHIQYFFQLFFISHFSLHFYCGYAINFLKTYSEAVSISIIEGKVNIKTAKASIRESENQLLESISLNTLLFETPVSMVVEEKQCLSELWILFSQMAIAPRIPLANIRLLA